MAGKIKQLISRFWWLFAIVAILMAGVLGVWYFLGRERGTTPTVSNPTLNRSTTGENVIDTALQDEGERLQIGMSEGQAQPQATETSTIVEGQPLTEDEVEAILARLPALSSEPQDEREFKLPEESLPPPRAGETIKETFPPSRQPLESAPVATGPLEVLRYAPEGEIGLAPLINITFNQPMVPLATIEALSEQQVPVQLEPDLPGTWRWLGTRTLTFQYDSDLIDRLPMATEYQVSIPAGTESVTGGVLGETVNWTFQTPPPQMVEYYPAEDSQPLDPVFFVGFDQRIEPAAVLDTIEVTADGEPVNIRLADEETIETEKALARLIERAGEGRWLAFIPVESLPTDSAIQVTVGPGTPSAEGPLVSETSQSFIFRTYAPLRIDGYGCSWGDELCQPLTPLYIRFNNPIDAQVYSDSMLSIEPGIPGASVDIIGNTITIRGATEGQTTYRVKVDGSIQDIFGQSLGEDESLQFRVGPAEPRLYGPEEILVTLDPAARSPVFSVYTMNYNRLELKIYAVEPGDWPGFQAYLRDYQRTDQHAPPPGDLVLDETIPVEAATDKLTEVRIGLSQVMDDDEYGHFIVIVEPPRGLFPTEQDRYWRTVQVWVQVTQIGLDAFVDHSRMVVWTTDLQDGSPLAGVTIGSEIAVTGEDGTARIDLPASGIPFLIARNGSDSAILPPYPSYWDETGWQLRPVNDELRWYVFDDRGMYRPGEEVHVKGWLRKVGGAQNGDVGLVGGEVVAILYQVTDPQGNPLGEGNSEVNALGGFDFVFTIPENANLGYAQVMINAEGNISGLWGREYYHTFQIQEFRRPEFEVSARNETTGPYLVDEHAVVAVKANYYAGGALVNAEVTWRVSSSPSYYEPPNWPDFTFGKWAPWWWFYEPVSEMRSFEPYGDGNQGVEYEETFSGVTDVAGEHYLRLDFERQEPPQPVSVLAEAEVMDVNRQAWVDMTSLLVHPAELYVGLRSERTFVERGDPLVIDLIVTDIDGIPISDRLIEVEAARLEWKHRGGEWLEEQVDVQNCQVGSQQEPVSCTFETTVGGRYQITAMVSDAVGRKNQSQFTRWVSGGQRPPSRDVEQEIVSLIPDKETYQPGDVAQILVQAPFSPAEGLLTVARSGILYSERFSMDVETTTLQVPIEEEHIPNLNLQVDLVGSAPRLDDNGEILEGVPDRPAYASGQLNLNIPPLQRTLSLQVMPAESELEPGGKTSIELELTDAIGLPVEDAELAVVVVDEAILALTNYQLSDPMTVFYLERSAEVSSHYGRASIVLLDPLSFADQTDDLLRANLGIQATVVVEMEAAVEAPAMEEAEAGQDLSTQPEAIQVRTDFNPLATFAPLVRTDPQGRATVKVELPDNLTRYRVMVVAVDQTGRRFGMGESNLTARLPLMVRPSAPRFLNFGDRFELPVVLQNQTDDALTVDVVVQATNLELTDGQGLRVSVPANDRVEVRFPAQTVQPGTARLQLAAVSGDYADAATVELPVYTPATTEAFATYGVIDEGTVAQPVSAPENVFSQFGGLEINTSSTALQALTDAVLYLVRYPFDCSEQLASRILGVAALRDVLTAFSAEGLPSPEEMESTVENDIIELERLQNADGGFPYWRRGQDSIPYNSVHVAHALQRARLKGFAVPEQMQMLTLDYLRNIESHYPAWYDKYTRQTISAYALYVRNLMGDQDAQKARRLYNEVGLEELPLEAVAWLWQVLLDDSGSRNELEAIQRHINNRAVETAGAANFTTSYGDQAYLLLHSDRRTDALILDSLIAANPESDLIPKVVNGLLAHRTQGRWYNTQENVFVLLALDRYFNTYEAQTPDFIARVWLGETYAGEHAFVGRSTERSQIEIPMAFLVDETLGGGETQNLVLSKEGAGRLYYRLGLRYAPTDLELDPLDMGFVVQRVYEAVDDPEDVYQDEDGSWHIKAGARVRVRLTMVADNRRYHVALVDPLPAGLEIINPALAVSGSVPQDPNSPDYRSGWWWWRWYEHQNMRDERAEAFTPLLWEGVYEYTYVARATTPGTFVVPPVKAEEMYSPEVFGRSGSDQVLVE